MDEKTYIKEFATEAQLKNPVFMTAMNIIKSRLRKFGSLNVILGMMDNSCFFEPPSYVRKDIKAPNGDTVYHQWLDIVTRLKHDWAMENKCPAENKAVELDINGQFFDPYNKIAVLSFFKLMGDFARIHDNGMITEQSNITALSLITPSPYDTCEYSRITNKATEYLVTLGSPNESVIKAFYDEMLEKSAMCPNGNYEGVLLFNLNGSESVVFYGVRNRMFYAIRHIKDKERTDYCLDSVDNITMGRANSEFTQDHVDDDRSNTAFDVRAFLVNLWAARVSKSFEVSPEPNETRPYIGKVTGTKKPDFKSYSYVKITPEGEREYEESKRVINSVKGDCEYRKSVWFTRAYYAARGADKRIVLCAASIHHRKCAPVTAQAKPVIYC